MLARGKVEKLVILALLSSWATVLVSPVSAGFPVVSNVVVLSVGSNTVLNVTVSHTPQTQVHYLDRIEVDVSGDNRIFPVASRLETTFVVQCDLGIVPTPTDATIRAHCIVDGYSLSQYGPILVSEFSSMLLPFFVVATLLAVMVARASRKRASLKIS